MIGPPGPAGAVGAVGPAGPTGPAGASGYELVTVAGASNTNATKTTNAPCPAGKVAVGGGYLITGATAGLEVTYNATSAANNWRVTASRSTANAWGLTVQVICLTGP